MENKKGQSPADNEKKPGRQETYSTDQQQEEAFPGYPQYPADEDITRAKNNNGKQSLNEENIALPNAFDIPGQEHITPAPLGELADTTASSADEEDIVHGDSLDEDDEVKIVMGTEADVTKEDLALLRATDQNMDDSDDHNLIESELDDTDEDGDPLNEGSSMDDFTGKDLDIPGGELDDADENTGEEDEENNYYSLGGDDKENLEDDRED